MITAPETCHKALGVHWHTATDNLHVATPILNHLDKPTKRQVTSDVAKTFDILGWHAPAIVKIKILLQKMWQRKLEWDEAVPEDLEKEWLEWRKSLPFLTQQPVPRCYFLRGKDKFSIQLHGYCDASKEGWCCIPQYDLHGHYYLVTAKTKVAPLTPTTIPRLELCGALLLAKLLETTREALDVSWESVYAWTDSSIVLSWLNSSPSRRDEQSHPYLGESSSSTLEAHQYGRQPGRCCIQRHVTRGLMQLHSLVERTYLARSTSGRIALTQGYHPL